MSTLSRIRASLFNKTESPPPSIRSTFHQAIQAGDYRKVQKLLDDPQNRADAIHVFASTAWSNFPYQHTKPGEHQDFLRCGLRIALMALEDTDMGAQAWAAWTTPQHASDPMPAQKVAQLEGHQNEFARALGEAMRKLGRQHHPWVAEQDLPPEQQFFYKWFHHYAQRGVNSDAWPSVNVTNHWVQTTGALYTQGWEDEYTDRVFNCRAISSPEEALTLLAHVDIHKKSRLDGIDGCNALHRLARFSERDYSTNILEALHRTRFQDSPNQVGEWGTQAMLSRYVEMNNRAAAVRLFARQLPLKIDGPAETHPFALLAEEVRTKNKDHATADALLAAMHVGLPNVSLAFNRLNTESILNYGIYKGDANLVLAALKSGDRFEGRNRDDSPVTIALESWKNPAKTHKMDDVLRALATYAESHPEHIPTVVQCTAATIARFPDANWQALPYPRDGEIMAALEKLFPDFYKKPDPQQSFDFA